MTAPNPEFPLSLRGVIEAACAEHQCSLQSLTVMSNMTDPYRIDTPRNHALGQWFADARKRAGVRAGIHLRGCHYIFVSVEPPILKPDGTPYQNTTDDWLWLLSLSNVARWLGYVGFQEIVDERNAAPIIV